MRMGQSKRRHSDVDADADVKGDTFPKQILKTLLFLQIATVSEYISGENRRSQRRKAKREINNKKKNKERKKTVQEESEN